MIMASSAANLILLITLSIFINIPQILIHAQQQVPCLFIFGDSLSDNGNNNVLITLAKSNYPPYGIDYPDGSTGRFSNGENMPDVLARLLGFPNRIPPFATARGSDILKGVNYASGGAGILDETGLLLGGRISMNQQLANHRITVTRIQLLLRRNRTSDINNYLNRCLHVVIMGSNDYINNYFVPNSPTRFLQTPDRFAETLIQRFSQQLRFLYNSGARKVAVFGVGLLGCIPQVIANNPISASGCVDFVNDAVQLFNNRLKPLVDNHNRDLIPARFTYINATSISSGDPSVLGVRVLNASCCPVSTITGLCIRNSNPCRNRTEYAFWDNFHPTETMNKATASRAYNAASPSDAYPVDIRRLAQQ